MPKNPMASNEGFRAMAKRLAGAKQNKPMKGAKARPKAQSTMVTAVNPSMSGS
jgi:hypothetical protein